MVVCKQLQAAQFQLGCKKALSVFTDSPTDGRTFHCVLPAWFTVLCKHLQAAQSSVAARKC